LNEAEERSKGGSIHQAKYQRMFKHPTNFHFPRHAHYEQTNKQTNTVGKKQSQEFALKGDE
jgi:hypothetical protein